MTKLLRAGLVALLGFAVATPAALASKVPVAHPEKGHMSVQDDAGTFDKDSVVRAEAKFHGITFKSPTHVKVMTVQHVPKERKAEFDKAMAASSAKDAGPKRAFMRSWARELAAAETDRGVFVLICTDAKTMEVVADEQTDVRRHFSDADCKTMAERIAVGFKEAEKLKTEDEKKVARGEGLVSGIDFLIGQLKNTVAPEATAHGTTHTDGGTHEPRRSGMPWWGWVIVVVGVLLFIWVLVAVIRAMTGNVYGPGYGGYYYGGGWGGGFWPCFMGGMFGTMAGMWMYNSMFGGHMYYDSGMAAAGTYPEGGYDPNGGDTGAGDYDNGSAGGADWGDDTGGGANDGGGGGDWGNDGGGDTGGGDWGGDGGGGDWGGDAGGGDFGGGGGDW